MCRFYDKLKLYRALTSHIIPKATLFKFQKMREKKDTITEERINIITLKTLYLMHTILKKIISQNQIYQCY